MTILGLTLRWKTGAIWNLEPELLEYWYTETQLSNVNASSLLSDVVAYGDEGVIKGDGTIYNSLNPSKIQSSYIPDALFDDNIDINYNTFISNPATSQCGLYGLEFAIDNNKIKTINDFINNKNILDKNPTKYSNNYFINSDNSILTTIRLRLYF